MRALNLKSRYELIVYALKHGWIKDKKLNPELKNELSPMQYMVLQLLINGDSIKVIANDLKVSDKDVSYHIVKIVKKFKITPPSLTKVIRFGFQLGFKVGDVPKLSDLKSITKLNAAPNFRTGSGT